MISGPEIGDQKVLRQESRFFVVVPELLGHHGENCIAPVSKGGPVRQVFDIELVALAIKRQKLLSLSYAENPAVAPVLPMRHHLFKEVVDKIDRKHHVINGKQHRSFPWLKPGRGKKISFS